MNTYEQTDIPPPPEPPEDYECCNNGCDELCVFEIYKQQKADYDAKYASLKTANTQNQSNVK